MSARLSKLTVVLFGKTGNGKSSTGNTLLGDNKFNNELSTRGVTEEIQHEICRIVKGNRKLEMVVVDTPGMFECGKIERNAMTLFDVETLNPDVFLLVLHGAVRFTEEEQLTVDFLRIIFGENVFQNTIIIVTYGDNFADNEKLNKFLTASTYVQTLMELCGNRVLKIDNGTKNFDWASFLRFTDEIKRNTSTPYKNKYSNIHKETVRTYFQQNRKGKPLIEQLQEISEQIAERIPNWRVRLLICGAVIGGACLVTAAVMAKPAAGAAAASSVVQHATTAAAAVVVQTLKK